MPSLKFVYAALPWTGFFTTNSGIDGEIVPDIGPTARRSWFGRNATSPRARRAAASSALRAQPS